MYEGGKSKSSVLSFVVPIITVGQNGAEKSLQILGIIFFKPK